jgi:thiol-disulfide isomerase/thioredoxin
MALCAIIACSQSNSDQKTNNAYRIEGTLIGAKDGDIILLMRGRQRDSIKITNEKFMFNFTMEHPDMISLFPLEGGIILRMFVEPGEVKVMGEVGALAGATLRGDGVKNWVYYTSKTRGYDEADRAARLKMSRNEQLTDEDMAAIRTAQAKGREARIETIRTRPDSPLSGFLLNYHFVNQREYALGKELYDGLSEKGKASFYAQLFKTTSDKQGQLEHSRGKQAPAFTLTDKNGKNISLSDYKGKYLLLDFWGSWCNPCRRSHPHLVELYNKYKGKNFDIIGLANERDTIGERWRQAIKDDKLTWKQANLTANKTGKAVLNSYNVNAFPTKFLIDPKGEIMNFYVGSGGTVLDDKLKEIFGK